MSDDDFFSDDNDDDNELWETLRLYDPVAPKNGCLGLVLLLMSPAAAVICTFFFV